MWIAPGALFLALASFLHLFERISSEPRTLEHLFPGYNGGMPPAVQFCIEDQLRNFNIFGDKRMIYIPRYLVKRGHIIFGWTWGWGGSIRDPYRLFSPLENVFIVFDMNEAKWVTLPHTLYRKLGTGHLFDLLLARDELAANHKLNSNHPVYKEAHIRACKQANDRVDIVEEEQMQLLEEQQTSIGDIVIRIKGEYSQTYDREFTRYLHQRGEYSINGLRERHT